MSRATLRRALDLKDGSSTALVPLIWRHAFHLEQMRDVGLPMAAEAMARALRNLASLYEVDAVTVGADGAHLATACWTAAQPSLSSQDAWSAVRDRRPLDVLPEAKLVPASGPMAVLIDVAERLRFVLGERAGIAFVLPDAGELAASVGLPEAVSWANRVLVEAVRAVGPVEPELILLYGTEARVETRLANVCGFFRSDVLHLAENVPGKAALSPTEFSRASSSIDETTWLWTTGTEVPECADPASLASALLELRQTLADRAAARR